MGAARVNGSELVSALKRVGGPFPINTVPSERVSDTSACDRPPTQEIGTEEEYYDGDTNKYKNNETKSSMKLSISK